MPTQSSSLERRLRSEDVGEVLFDPLSRGLYATDASFYQIMPRGVVIPRTVSQARRSLAIAAEAGVPVLPRGGGTSQSGQTVNDALVIDTSKYLTRILSVDIAGKRCTVEPGIVLDELNRQLRPHGLWFPVDISTASRATIGGMAGNNSCGGRSLRYGTMRSNVVSIEAALADGAEAHFGHVRADMSDMAPDAPQRALVHDLLAIGEREADEVANRFPAVQRRVGGYNLDALTPPGRQSDGQVNLAHLLVGSEGTLGFSTAIELQLWPLLGKRGVGVCHFGSFHEAMDAAQHIVALKPIAVELVDRTMLALAQDIDMFRPTLKAFLRGEPEAVLVVEFAETDDENRRRVKALGELMGDLGFGWSNPQRKWGGVVEVFDPALQTAITELRTAGLNIMMSMKDARKPVSFVEDCAVSLPRLAEYTDRLSAIFARHGTRGTWYAHASEGCLHVRPVLNLKLDLDVRAMRAIAEEAFAMVREFKGSHSGEHGDGIVRSWAHEFMYGERLVRAFEEVKDRFDPKGLFNPGKITRAPAFDDRRNFRYGPDYRPATFKPALDWRSWDGPADGFLGAVEMCNNNGACRSLQGGVMCPSYRATRNESDVTRGRANALRLALTGQAGSQALTSDALAETLKLCVSCKACRRECPTGVDMARMKIEVLAARASAGLLTMRDRAIAFLPRYAALAARLHGALNLRNSSQFLRRLGAKVLGLAPQRALPRWRPDVFREAGSKGGLTSGREVVLFVDTFNRAFAREKIEAAVDVLTAGGYQVHFPQASSRPLCCGRTFLSAGLVDEARAEAQRVVDALQTFVARDVVVIGLEPSCLLTLRDEFLALLPGDQSLALSRKARLFAEFIAGEQEAGRLRLPLQEIGARALLHGHCHEKSFGAMAALETTLRLVPGLDVETAKSGCCGMAGAFGYQAETFDVSMKMAEAGLLPAVRAMPEDALIVADGFSCCHQIHDGAQRQALHVAEVLQRALKRDESEAST